MQQRLSISRLMVTIGLLGTSLSVLKSWVGPTNFFGFLGLIGWMILNCWVAAYATSGSARRFFVGSGVTGTFLLIAVFLAPATIMGTSWERLIFPAIRSFGTFSNRNYYQYQWYWVGSNLRLNAHFDQGFWGWLQIRTTIGLGSPDIQVLLLIPQAILTFLGGAIATFARRTTNRPTESLATSIIHE
jgi:hypothetical protein